MTLEKRSNHLRLLLFSTYLLDISTRHFYNFHNYSAGTIPQGIFCEHSSQNPRESLREIMQSMISVHSEACYCEGTAQLPIFSIFSVLLPRSFYPIHSKHDHSQFSQIHLPFRLKKFHELYLQGLEMAYYRKREYFIRFL